MKIKVGDWFTENLKDPFAQSTKVKKHQCIEIGNTRIFYIDGGKKHWNYEYNITKCDDGSDLIDKTFTIGEFTMYKFYETKTVCGEVTIYYKRTNADVNFHNTLENVRERFNNDIWKLTECPNIASGSNNIWIESNLSPFTEEYTTKQEEIMKNLTNDIEITVPTLAYAETTTITSYGVEVNTSNEEQLVSLIAKIDNEQDQLKVLNKNAKSKRLIGQINKLGEARNKIVAMLDALPEEE